MQALVIDDSKAMRGILRNMLRIIGFTVTEAENGREGLEALRRLGRPDVVFVDWNMPEMSGIEFLRAARADPAYRSLRVMMATTETDPAQVALALEAGADAHLGKPFTQEAVLRKLQALGVVPGEAGGAVP